MTRLSSFGRQKIWSKAYREPKIIICQVLNCFIDVLIQLCWVSAQRRHRISLDTVQRKDFVLPALEHERPRIEEGLASHVIEQDVRPGERGECCVSERDDVQPQHGQFSIEVILEALGVFRSTHEGDKVFATAHNLWAGGRL